MQRSAQRDSIELGLITCFFSSKSGLSGPKVGPCVGGLASLVCDSQEAASEESRFELNAIVHNPQTCTIRLGLVSEQGRSKGFSVAITYKVHDRQITFETEREALQAKWF